MNLEPPFRVEPLDATFGAIVIGLKLAELDDAAFRALHETWLDYALLVFPDQHLSNAQQVAFARRFGDLELECLAITNLRADGTVLQQGDDGMDLVMGNLGWHCDSTYRAVQAKGAVLTAHVVPSAGGETEWADLRAAYEALSPELQARIAQLNAHHSFHHSQAKLGFAYNPKIDRPGYEAKAVGVAALRPLVKPHSETGRNVLAIGRHAYGIPGLEPDESERLLAELTEFACQPPRTWAHRWAPGDAVLWDNRSLMHRLRPWNMSEPRVLFHSRIAGDPVRDRAIA